MQRDKFLNEILGFADDMDVLHQDKDRLNFPHLYWQSTVGARVTNDRYIVLVPLVTYIYTDCYIVWAVLLGC